MTADEQRAVAEYACPFCDQDTAREVQERSDGIRARIAGRLDEAGL